MIAGLREPLEQAYVTAINRSVLLSAAMATLLALALGALLAYTISRPVRELTDATRAVAQGELGRQVPVRTRDELGELATSFNHMSEDLARANQTRQQMTADIAHDLRDSLT
ncbi:MAG: HAMP domain-containing protein [Chloroflexota bacterium]